MSQLLIQIIAIGTKNFFLVSILYGGHNSPNSFNIMHSTTHKQWLLLFPSNKLKKIEMQKHKDSDNINVKCKYCNWASKF
jgi:hypothetical protein